jgi:DNA-binding GntR family transcriptional regulator
MKSENGENGFVPQYPPSLVSQVAAFLTTAIVEGQYKSGQRLVESELQRKFGISRSPIREALLILEKNNLLVNIPRKGRVVRSINAKDIEENFIVRASLESLAARLAVPRLTPEHIKKMESALWEMARGAKAGDYQVYFQFNCEFHDTFISASHNDTLIKVLENLRYQITWFRYSQSSANQGFYEYLIPVHRRILKSFVSKEADRAEKFVKEHILDTLDGMLRLFSQKSEADELNVSALKK